MQGEAADYHMLLRMIGNRFRCGDKNASKPVARHFNLLRLRFLGQEGGGGVVGAKAALPRAGGGSTSTKCLISYCEGLGTSL